MAQQTYTVTVASGNLYGGGTGNVFYLDGARNSTGPGTVNWVNGATLRFDQSDASNDGHPLIFSTTTSRDQYLTSGVTYYLDGASNYANYINTTTFNAATTRYVEVTPSSETDFYYLCYVHGIGMGGIFDITQETWGALAWNFNSWGNQDEVFISPTAVTLATSLGTAEAFPEQGWGSDTWGFENWGESSIDAVLTGLDLTIGFGAKEAWGTSTWNASTTEWGGPFVPGVAIGQQVPETGQQLGTNVGTVSTKTATEIFQTGLAITSTVGSVADRTDVFPTSQLLTASLGTAEGQNEQGWGRDAWGTEVWGAEGDWITCTPTGVTSSISLGNESTDISVNVLLTPLSVPGWGQSIGWGQQKWNQASVDMGMSTSSGTVDPAPDTALTGVQATISLGVEVVSADANLTLSGIALSMALGNEDAVPNTQVDLTGIAMSTTLQGVVAGTSALVSPTGVTSTFTQGIIGLNAWELVDSGATPTWTVVDKAA
tara:strand:+ start:601 stop:2061 length:1461 start_codon:yes stop_codon:yes gene_type:complete